MLPITFIIQSTQQLQNSPTEVGGGKLPAWMYGMFWETAYISCMSVAAISGLEMSHLTRVVVSFHTVSTSRPHILVLRGVNRRFTMSSPQIKYLVN